MMQAATRSIAALTVGAVVLAIGVAQMVGVLCEAPRLQQRMRSKQADLQSMRALEKRLTPYRSAYKLAEDNSDPTPNSVQAILKKHAGLKGEVVRNTPESLGQNWQRVRTSVSFAGADVSAVMAFVDDAALASVPWRLAQCEMRASPRGTGTADMTIQLDQLVRQ